MRVGVFTDSYKPYLGGVVRSIESFTKDLQDFGHQVSILAPNYPGVTLEKDIFRFPSIPSLSYGGYYIGLPFSLKLKDFLEQHPFDVIHVHSPFVLGRLGAKVAKKKNLPLVFTYHTLYDQYTHYIPFARKLGKEITRKICVDFCNQCNLVITPTEIIGQHIANMGVTSQIKTLPTGINLDEFIHVDRTWLRRTYGIGQDQLVLLFVGRTGKEKNIPFIIDSFYRVLEHTPQAKLVIVGEGPESANLQAYVESRGLCKQVIFTGKLARKDLVKSYCGADLFIFGSLTETQGIVLAEAKAAGLPVVAVKAFGVSNMIVDYQDGFLVPQDIDLFANRVLLLINNASLRKRMSLVALSNAQNFSSTRCSEKLIEFYQDLMIQQTNKVANPMMG